MVARTQINRSRVDGQRPADNTRFTGEMFVNLEDRQISIIDQSQDVQDLIAARFWSIFSIYHAGDVVWRSGELYTCIAATATEGTFDPLEWDRIANMSDVVSASEGATAGLRPYSAAAIYALNDLVSYTGNIYRNIVAISIPEPWNPAKWQNIVPPPLPEPIPFFDVAVSYVLNDLVVYQGSIYRAIGAVPAGTFVPAQWQIIAPIPADGGPTNEAPSDGKYYVRQNGTWIDTIRWEAAGADVLLKISGTGVIRISAAGLLMVKGDVEVFSVAI